MNDVYKCYQLHQLWEFFSPLLQPRSASVHISVWAGFGEVSSLWPLRIWQRKALQWINLSSHSHSPSLPLSFSLSHILWHTHTHTHAHTHTGHLSCQRLMGISVLLDHSAAMLSSVFTTAGGDNRQPWPNKLRACNNRPGSICRMLEEKQRGGRKQRREV